MELSRRIFNNLLLGGILFPCLPKLNLYKRKIVKANISSIHNFDLYITYSDGLSERYKFKNVINDNKNFFPVNIDKFQKLNCYNRIMRVYHDKQNSKFYMIVKVRYGKKLKNVFIELNGLEAVGGTIPVV